MLKETIYTPNSELKNIKELVVGIFKSFHEGSDLAKRLFIRNKKAMYRQSVFGIVWAFLPPIATSLIWILLRGQNVVNFGTTDIPYPVYVFSGMMLWQIFVDAVQTPLRTIQQSKQILVKLNFPREALLLAAFYEVLFNAGVKLVVLTAFLIITQTIPTTMIVFAPIALLALVFLGLSIGVFLTPIGMLYSDIQKGLQIVFQFLMFMLPVIYPLSTSGAMHKINVFNPITPLLMNARNWITNGAVYDLDGFVFVSCLSVVMLCFSILIYRIAIPHLVERMGS